jgi:hypothetical protein
MSTDEATENRELILRQLENIEFTTKEIIESLITKAAAAPIEAANRYLWNAILELSRAVVIQALANEEKRLADSIKSLQTELKSLASRTKRAKKR